MSNLFPVRTIILSFIIASTAACRHLPMTIVRDNTDEVLAIRAVVDSFADAAATRDSSRARKFSTRDEVWANALTHRPGFFTAVRAASLETAAFGYYKKDVWLTLKTNHQSCRGPEADRPTFLLRRAGTRWLIHDFWIGNCRRDHHDGPTDSTVGMRPSNVVLLRTSAQRIRFAAW